MKCHTRVLHRLDKGSTAIPRINVAHFTQSKVLYRNIGNYSRSRIFVPMGRYVWRTGRYYFVVFVYARTAKSGTLLGVQQKLVTLVPRGKSWNSLKYLEQEVLLPLQVSKQWLPVWEAFWYPGLPYLEFLILMWAEYSFQRPTPGFGWTAGSVLAGFWFWLVVFNQLLVMGGVRALIWLKSSGIQLFLLVRDGNKIFMYQVPLGIVEFSCFYQWKGIWTWFWI